MTTAVAPSFDDLVGICRGVVQLERPELTFNDGDVTEAFAHGGAAMNDAVIGYLANRLRALFFGTAKGAALDTLIMDRIKLPRSLGTQAYGLLDISRTGGTGASGSLAAGFEWSTPVDATGVTVTYTLDVDLTIPSGNFSTTVAAHAADFGTAGNRAGNSTALRATATLFDPAIACTNTGGMAGGTASESDEDYVARAIGYWMTQRRGTLQAIEQGALEVPGVTVAHAVDDTATGLCTLYVSDSDGNSTLQMEHLVRAAMEVWRAAGVPVTIVGGQRAGVTLSISIDEYSVGFDVAAAAQTISDSITNRVNSLKLNRVLRLDSIVAAAIAPYAQDITDISFVAIAINGVAQPLDQDISAPGKLIRLDATVTVIDGGAA